MDKLPESGQAGALHDEHPVSTGVVLVRNWLDTNFGDIRDGAEPGITQLVRDLLSLANKHEAGCQLPPQWS
jgi:hypothetical protein